jgi:hypothetical protein
MDDLSTGPAVRYSELLGFPPDARVLAASQAIDPGGWRVRQADYEFLISPQARDVLQQEGIVVLDYRAIQRAWVQPGSPRSASPGRLLS